MKKLNEREKAQQIISGEEIPQMYVIESLYLLD